jgi:transcriptional regulator with XRE-family HTH domain
MLDHINYPHPDVDGRLRPTPRQDPRKPDPVDEHVGKAVRARREALGMSQEALAQRLGLTFQQVQKYEKATNRVSASRLVAIAHALKTTPAAFLPPATPIRRPRSAEFESALAALHGLIDQHKVAIAALEDVSATLARATIQEASDE